MRGNYITPMVKQDAVHAVFARETTHLESVFPKSDKVTMGADEHAGQLHITKLHTRTPHRAARKMTKIGTGSPCRAAETLNHILRWPTTQGGHEEAA